MTNLMIYTNDKPEGEHWDRIDPARSLDDLIAQMRAALNIARGDEDKRDRELLDCGEDDDIFAFVGEQFALDAFGTYDIRAGESPSEDNVRRRTLVLGTGGPHIEAFCDFDEVTYVVYWGGEYKATTFSADAVSVFDDFYRTFYWSD